MVAFKLALCALVLLAAPMALGCNTNQCPLKTTGIPTLPPPMWRPNTCPVITCSGSPVSCRPWSTVTTGRCCGTPGYPKCPLVSCSSSFSSASSGPNQCAVSFGAISAVSTSQSSFDAMTNYTATVIKYLCDAPEADKPDAIEIASAALATAYAEAAAVTQITSTQFVCYNKRDQCGSYCRTCKGGSAYNQLQASVQAVAVAVARSFALATGLVFDGYSGGPTPPPEDAYAFLLANATGIADAVNIAFDTYYSSIGGANGGAALPNGYCDGHRPHTQCKRAVAQALSCAFASVFAKVYYSDDSTSVLNTCAASFAISYTIGSDDVIYVGDQTFAAYNQVCENPYCKDPPPCDDCDPSDPATRKLLRA